MKAFLFVFIMLASVMAKAQTWDEIFRQKATQKKYLLQQIAAIKMYAMFLKNGYDIANKGINTVRDLSKGEFDLHQSFFNSLETINPKITGNYKIVEAIAMQVSIINSFRFLRNEVDQPADRLYIEEVRTKVLKDCEFDIEELLSVITAGKLELKDDERINRLNKINTSLQEKYQFTQYFVNEVRMRSSQKSLENRDIETAGKLYGF